MEIEHDDLIATTQTVQFILAKYLNITCLLTDLLIKKKPKGKQKKLEKEKQANKQTNEQTNLYV